MDVRAEPVIRARRLELILGQPVWIVALGKGGAFRASQARNFQRQRPGGDKDNERNQHPHAKDRWPIPSKSPPSPLIRAEMLLRPASGYLIKRPRIARLWAIYRFQTIPFVRHLTRIQESLRL